jgi:hypothetical protein
MMGLTNQNPMTGQTAIQWGAILVMSLVIELLVINRYNDYAYNSQYSCLAARVRDPAAENASNACRHNNASRLRFFKAFTERTASDLRCLLSLNLVVVLTIGRRGGARGATNELGLLTRLCQCVSLGRQSAFAMSYTNLNFKVLLAIRRCGGA